LALKTASDLGFRSCVNFSLFWTNNSLPMGAYFISTVEFGRKVDGKDRFACNDRQIKGLTEIKTGFLRSDWPIRAIGQALLCNSWKKSLS
jgi:hypothetical protein